MLRASRAFVFIGFLAGSSAVRLSDEQQVTTNYWDRLLQRMKADPTSVYTTLNGAVQGVNASIAEFSKKPPNLVEGFASIQHSIWAVVDLLVDPEFKGTDQYTNAKKVWEDGFTKLPAETEEAVAKFNQDGDLVAFKGVIDRAINISELSAATAFPELSTAFEACGILMRGITAGWVLYTEGKTELALQSIWDSFKLSIAGLVGEEKASDPKFRETMKDLDGVVTNLLENIVKFKKAKLESKICYKQSKVRTSRNPSKCENKDDWFYPPRQGICFPKITNGADCYNGCKDQLGQQCLACPSSKKWCCRKGLPSNSPECADALYVDHSYANGTASDYYQCVEPLLESLVEVSGDARLEEKAVKLDTAQGLVARQTAALSRGRKLAKLDDALGWKCMIFFWRRSCNVKQEKPEDLGSLWGTHPARCDSSSDHPALVTLQGRRLCLGLCGSGYSVVKDGDNETQECQQNCASPFGKAGIFGQSPLKYPVCSNTTSDLDHANTQLLQITANTIVAVNSAVQTINSKEGYNTAQVVNKLVNAFAELATSFNRPQCKFE